MTTYLSFDALATALNAESWNWLQDANIGLARALQAEVNRGATAQQIRDYARAETDGYRGPFVTRLRQAAEYLAAQVEREQEAS